MKLFRTLLKKELLQLNSFYFFDKKKGKRRSPGQIVGFVLLMLFVFGSLTALFAGLAVTLGSVFIPAGLDWLYFALTGLISVFISSILNMFIANSSLYTAKDNELLLAMPIPPSRILAARTFGLYLWGLLYSAISFLPAVVVYPVVKGFSAAAVIFPLAVFVINSFLILTLSCVFGWVVALISSRLSHLKNRAFISTALALLFLAAYYIVYFRLIEMLKNALAFADTLSNAVRTWLFPFYHMGLAAAGVPLSLLGWLCGVAVLCALTFLILSRSFLKIATLNRGTKKAEYKQTEAKTSGVDAALLKKELRRFTSSSAYMLNVGLGIILTPAIGIALLVKAPAIRGALNTLAEASGDPRLFNFFLAVLPLLSCFCLSMDCFTAPSVSLEGKNVWILQTMPVDPYRVLRAKLRAHLILGIPPAVIFSACAGIALQAGLLPTAAMILFAVCFVLFQGAAGLLCNLLLPNLDWTNEVVPIKQGASVGIALFGCWILALLFGGIAYLLRRFLDAAVLILIFSLVLLIGARLIVRWLRGRGAEIFSRL